MPDFKVNVQFMEGKKSVIRVHEDAGGEIYTIVVTTKKRPECGAGVVLRSWNERVLDHAALPEELMQVASVESNEAVLMIREGLWRIKGIHDFLRLTV